MNDWTTLIVSWPEKDAGPSELTKRHIRRLKDITANYRQIVNAIPERSRAAWVVISGADAPKRLPALSRGQLSDSPAGGSSLFAASTQESHFDPKEFAQALGEFEWETPEAVQWLWKSELADKWSYGSLISKPVEN